MQRVFSRAVVASPCDHRPPLFVVPGPGGRPERCITFKFPPRAAVCARRIALSALVPGIALCAFTPSAAGAFGVTERNFEAGTCLSESCTYASPASAFYTQAAGHPPVAITSFKFNAKPEGLGEAPEGNVKNVRVDIPPGLAANPEALPQCSRAAFEQNKCDPSTQVGTNDLVVYASGADIPLSGNPVYNLEQSPGLPLDFGIHVAIEPLVNTHIYLEGHVSSSTDYHEYFEINNLPREGEALGLKVPLAILSSKLIFNGRAGNGNFLTLPSVCSSTTTSHLRVESYEGAASETDTHPPTGVDGCDRVPFHPTTEIGSATTQSDAPDGPTVEVKAAQNAGPEEINTADIRDAHLTLPEGMTLNPSAAHELGVCTAAQIAIGSTGPVTCPAAAKIGSVVIETDLPPGSLAGNIYLGDPGGGAITGPPYTLYVDAESQYGVSVRLQGAVNPNPSTGRLETTFLGNPQLPFSDLIVTFNGGALAPLANPLVCGSAQLEAIFSPYTGGGGALSTSRFVTTGCAASGPPFALAQGTTNQSAKAGAYTSYTLNLSRGDGQQYLQQVKTILPPGLLGAIPSVPLCGEPQAAQGTCPASSRVGLATVAAGAGPMPYSFSGPVSLTGPTGGGPYGLSIAIPAVAGPFNLGTVVTRAAISVDPYTGRVIATSTLPTIVKGVPLRLKDISVAFNRPNFLFNPTSCGALETNSTLTSTFGAVDGLSSPFVVSGCSGLKFTPTLTASTGGKSSKQNGASFEVKMTQGAHQANIRQVILTLPKRLPSRLTTLQKACPAALFEDGPPPGACPSTSRVGGATVSTPVLSGRLTGPAYLVSHGGASFPDLELVLRGDGVEVVLVGHTRIAGGTTTSKFETLPDVPITGVAVSLPTGPRSLLGANGVLCKEALTAPTTIIAQSGAKITRKTRIAVTGCPVTIAAHRTSGTEAIVSVMVPGAGRLSARGPDLRPLVRHVGRAGKTTLKVQLTRAGVAALRTRGRLKLRLRVGFLPHSGHHPSRALTSVTFRS